MDPLRQAIFIFIFIGLPLLFTVLNLLFAFLNLKKKSGRKALFWEVPALLIGFFYMWILFSVLSDWPAAIDRVDLYLIKYHTPLASWHLPTLLTFFFLSVIGFAALRIIKSLPPMVTAVCLASLLIACVTAALCVIQLCGNITYTGNDWTIVLSLLYPLNVILLYARVIRQKAVEMAAKIKTDPAYAGPVLNACAKLLCRGSGWVFISFLAALPLFCVVMIVLVLFGQRPDAILKVFTDTSEWTLSRQISPPDLEHIGHYLCTVAAQGHPRLVRPIRYGRRGGRRIIVNRQLCVANAFEQALSEKFPRLLKKIRRLYDTYGYPVSRHITTRFRADAVYLLMKPLEYLFLLFLYATDARPENRIAAQYGPLDSDL